MCSSRMLTLPSSAASNLAEANPELPDLRRPRDQSLGASRASVRQQGGKRDIVTEFLFVLTPLETPVN